MITLSRNKVERLYSKSRSKWSSLGIVTPKMTLEQVDLLKWTLEVALTNPLEKPMELISHNLVLNIRTDRYVYRVHLGFDEHNYLIVILDDGSVAFSPNADYELALRITSAFNKWCEIMEKGLIREFGISRI